MRIILEYMGARTAGSLVEGAKDPEEAIKTVNPKTFKPPVTVDWNNGRAVAGDNESEIMRMVAQLPKETGSV